MRTLIRMLALVGVIAAMSLPGFSQSNPKLQAFFEQNIGLSQDQIAAIGKGQTVATALPSRTPAEIFLFGAVYIHAAPEDYLLYSGDLSRLRKLPSYLAITAFSNPPQLSDLKDFSFDDEDIEALKGCKPGNCLIQMPARAIEEVHRSIDWSAPNVDEQVNQLVQKGALQFLLDYQREGNQAFGMYSDKRNPTVVPQQFAYMLSYIKVLPEYLPDFYQYLLDYPNAKPANVEDVFYWDKVKFGLKPTLRIVHVLLRQEKSPTAYVIAEKQLYSSHYFETALDLTFCLPGSDTTAPGFYLIRIMGSEQAGLTGLKGSIVRKAAVGRSVQSLRNTLTAIKTALESKQ